MQRAYLALADGAFFPGYAWGAEGERIGEVVFNTSLTGYQEILTDPSYKGQIVAMTYPHIGNYGVNHKDVESAHPQVEGFIVKEASRVTSNWRKEKSLAEYLREHGVPGIQGIDTRALVRKLRMHGAMQGIISTQDGDPHRLAEKVKAAPGLVGLDLVKEVTCPEGYSWGGDDLEPKWDNYDTPSPPNLKRVVAIDYGCKRNILRLLALSGCRVTVVPAATSAEAILSLNPDGIFLSNGPGDPAAVTYAVANIKKLIGQRPIFGICLGHQLLGLALGGRTFKLKFGHRGGNQPVMDLLTRKVEITSQNHGFCVDLDSLPSGEVELTHINLNDRTLEGFRHRKLPLFCVQYHPEASPGPHDSHYLFHRFIELMEA